MTRHLPPPHTHLDPGRHDAEDAGRADAVRVVLRIDDRRPGQVPRDCEGRASSYLC